MGSYIVEKSICQEALEVFPSESQGRMWLHITLTLSQSGYSADKKPRVVFFRERTRIGRARLTKGPFSSRLDGSSLYFTASSPTFLLSN